MDGTKKRRNGWVAWAAVACFVLPVLYVLSVGPACWIIVRLNPSIGVSSAMTVYAPIGQILSNTYTDSLPHKCLTWWIELGMHDGDLIHIPCKDPGGQWNAIMIFRTDHLLRSAP